MPTYEYHCDGCGREFEVKQRISEDALTTCEKCGGRVRRLISPAPFILKGEGWYVTDYPSASRKQAMDSEKTKSTTTTTDKGGSEKSSSSDGASTSSSASSTPSAPSSAPSKD